MSLCSLENNNNSDFQTYKVSDQNLYENKGNEFNTILTKLKAEVFGKEQSRKDYNALENRYQQLKNEISIISSDKNRIENELSKKINKGEKLIKKIKIENETLNNEINKKNLENKKLFDDNNNLYQALESNTIKNKKFHSKICEQKSKINSINKDIKNLENSLHSLNCLNKK